MEPLERSAAGTPPVDRLRSRWRAVGLAALHLAIAFHLFAILIAPSTIPPSSQLQRSMFLGAQPYLEVLNLNHGYHYFAPDPGESRLIDYTLPDGSSGRLPNKSIKPRLLYHRYFMLTESQPRRGGDSVRAAAHYEALAGGLTRHAGQPPTEIDRVTHRLARPQFIRAGFTLGDVEQFESEPVYPTDAIRASEQPPRSAEPAVIPLPLPEPVDD